jgi:hypothetical protein
MGNNHLMSTRSSCRLYTTDKHSCITTPNYLLVGAGLTRSEHLPQMLALKQHLYCVYLVHMKKKIIPTASRSCAYVKRCFKFYSFSCLIYSQQNQRLSLCSSAAHPIQCINLATMLVSLHTNMAVRKKKKKKKKTVENNIAAKKYDCKKNKTIRKKKKKKKF